MAIYDQKLIRKWIRIKKYLKTIPYVYEQNGMMTLDSQSHRIYIAKKSDKMRLKSHLDWVHYTPKTLASAIDLDQLDVYYELMMSNPYSDPNIWDDKDIEMELKTFYASRAGRAELI